MKLDIQMFADGKVVIDTELNSKNFENGLNRLQSTTQKAGNTIKSIVAGLGISKAISMAISTINNSIDSSISRLDTLRNFPKVMSNLGIAGDKAQASISKMSDKLAGLPTTLDQGALAVQRFTSANDDVEKSTDIFLALNNAILAGGASSEIQSNALEQLSQSYAKGKMDMMEWRAIQTAMPAQLKQVAKAMGLTTEELGEMMREGDNTREVIDEFMETIVRLNEEGIEGFQSFEEQARNSVGGIKTSIIVAKTQVVKGVTDIIDALDIKFEQLGFGKISDIISNFGKDAKKGLDSVAELIKGDTKKIILDGLKDLETTGPKMIENFTKGLTDKIPSVVNTAGDIFTQFIDTLNANIPALYESGLTIITTLVNSIAEQAPQLIPSLVETIIQLFMSITDSKNLDKIGQAGANLIIKLVEGILNSIPLLIENTDFTLKAFTNVMSGGQNLAKEIGFALIKALIKGIINSIPELAESAFKIVKAFIDKVTSFFGSIFSKGSELVSKFVKGIKDKGLGAIKDVGGQLISGLWQGIQSKWNGLINKVGQLAGGIVDKFKSVFGIKSPSKVMRDQVGKWLPLGMYEGFEDELDGVYRDMQKAINFENAKLQANVETGKVFNTLANTTPIYVQIDADVEMDNTKVGRIITPVVSETLKTGGLR